MINLKQLVQLQDFVKEQRDRKKKLGHANYPLEKFWEELIELQEELNICVKGHGISVNMINELGDFLFCVLGDPILAEELQERLDYNWNRAKRQKAEDLLKIQREAKAKEKLHVV
jgi:hypothetical protein